MSHDLRSPLRVIGGYAQLLRWRYGDGLDDQARHFMDGLVSASNRMARLIDDLLHYGRLGRGPVELEPVALGDVLDWVLASTADRARELGADISVAADPPVVRGNATLLWQVFTNLVENALTYARPGVPAKVRIS